MSRNYVPISEGDKAVIMMTGKLLSGKGYNAAEVADTLLNVMADPSGVQFLVEGLGKQNESTTGVGPRHLPPL